MSRLVPLADRAALLGGCGTGADRDQARMTVERFYDAIRGDGGAGACEQLGDSLREQVESQTGWQCRAAIAGLDCEGGAVVSAEVYVVNAKVDLASGESAFLGRGTSAGEARACAGPSRVNGNGQ